MADSSQDNGEERIIFAMLLGVIVGAALGTIVLQDVTVGVVAGVVAGTITALVFPAWTGQLFKNVTQLLKE